VLIVLRPSSSVDSSAEDNRLEERFVNIGLGGRRPAASKELLVALSGEPTKEALGAGDS